VSAVGVLLFSASLWGLTWWPLKSFAAAGLSGPLLAMLTYGFAGLVGLPWLLLQRLQWRRQTGMLLLIALVGGWGNTAFVSAMVLGDVVRVMLLFYLAPVWSVLGGRVFLGEQISARRALAVGLSLGGAFLVVGGMAAFATPPSAADLLAVTAGLAFSGNNILARKAQDIPAPSKTVGLLLGCGVTSALMLGAMAWFGEAPQATQFAAGFSWHIVLLLAAFSLFWLALVSFTWQWSVTRLEAGRSGVIAIAELVVALVSATLTGYETMTLLECIGAALIACAAVLEATDNPTDCATPLSTTSVIKDTA
jgi:drug/metabolite transporter (DMT)-like permease